MSGSAKSLIDVTPSSHSKNTMTKVVSEVLILREIVWLILLSAISFNARPHPVCAHSLMSHGYGQIHDRIIDRVTDDCKHAAMKVLPTEIRSRE